MKKICVKKWKVGFHPLITSIVVQTLTDRAAHRNKEVNAAEDNENACVLDKSFLLKARDNDNQCYSDILPLRQCSITYPLVFSDSESDGENISNAENNEEEIVQWLEVDKSPTVEPFLNRPSINIFPSNFN